MFFFKPTEKNSFYYYYFYFLFFPFGEPSARRIKFVSIASKEYLQYFLVFFFTPPFLVSVLVTSAHNSPNRLFFSPLLSKCIFLIFLDGLPISRPPRTNHTQRRV